MKRIVIYLFFLLLLPFSTRSLYSSFKTYLNKPRNELSKEMAYRTGLYVIDELKVLDGYNLNDPNFSKRLKGLREEIMNFKLDKIKQERLRMIEQQKKKHLLNRATSYKNLTITLGSSSAGFGISSLHNNAQHWYSSK